MRRLLLTLCLACAFVVPCASAQPAPSAQSGRAVADSSDPVVGYPVLLAGDTVFFLRTASGDISAAERAEIVSRRLADLSALEGFQPDSLRARLTDASRELIYDGTLLVRINPEDARFGADPDTLAVQWRDAILTSLSATKSEANLWRILTRVAGVAGILFLIVMVELLVFRLARRAKELITRFAVAGRLPVLRIQRVTLLTPQRSQEILQVLFRSMVTAVHLVVGYAALLLLFSVFPWTQDWAAAIFTWSVRPVRAAFQGFVEFIPDLFHIVIVLVLAHLFLRLLHRLAAEVEAGNLRFPGFYSDWGKPTFNIVRFVTYAFALVLIFPRLPGSDSVAFRGVSVFLGVLVSLGSSSAFSNIIAGIVMTYMRSFRDGDLINVGDVRGVVVEKTLLVTRLSTFHGETVTLPNSALLAGNTVNFTAAAKDRGLALHTQVTIGYDAPWRQVHALLLDAAARTPDVLKEPEPFVLQKALNDFYVSYELNAYTRESVRMNYVYSELHQNIQDAFAAGGVEIMSPHYRAHRDGASSTIPSIDAPKPNHKSNPNSNPETSVPSSASTPTSSSAASSAPKAQVNPDVSENNGGTGGNP